MTLYNSSLSASLLHSGHIRIACTVCTVLTQLLYLTSFNANSYAVHCTYALSTTAQPVYAELAAAAADLCSAVHSDFGASPADVSHDVFNNALHLKRPPKQPSSSSSSSSDSSSDTKLQYYHPADRNNRSLKNRYTTPRVEVGLNTVLSSTLLCFHSVMLAVSYVYNSLYQWRTTAAQAVLYVHIICLRCDHTDSSLRMHNR
jgi:hypothetical protein